MKTTEQVGCVQPISHTLLSPQGGHVVSTVRSLVGWLVGWLVCTSVGKITQNISG